LIERTVERLQIRRRLIVHLGGRRQRQYGTPQHHGDNAFHSIMVAQGLSLVDRV
jgi:hypothetical protein